MDGNRGTVDHPQAYFAFDSWHCRWRSIPVRLCTSPLQLTSDFHLPGSKLRHFKSIHKKTGIAYADMLFFDDESRNKEVEQLG